MSCEKNNTFVIILEYGGLAIIAHPGLYDSWELLDELLAAGLDGIEYYHECHSKTDYQKILSHKNSYPHLILTGGSDYHGVFGPLNSVGEINAPHSFKGFRKPIKEEFLTQVLNLVKEAGNIIRSNLFKEQTDYLKAQELNNLVSQTDLLIHQYLTTGLKTILPNSQVLSEEG